ncbi:DMT family transporter [Athalassotoga saccharophila]|uniref:DMT family transporter n=1 Tax=Athalassotoga saccharophila TaxID=1441386 RepID=UPI00137B6FD5|nr:DMT family transporter [Athalassotoga saccharophila]BBJ28530.1 EamA-like transporter [Athalassotoga saccharophila]
MGYFYVYAAIALFSSIEVVSKFIGNYVDPLNLWLFRLIFAILTLLPFVKFSYLKSLNSKDWVNLLWLGVISAGIGMSLYHLAVANSQANEMAIIFSSNPIFVLLFSKLFFKEKFSIRVYIGMILGFLGVIITSYSSDFKGDIYALLMVLSCVLFALLTVFGRTVVQHSSSATFNFMIFVIALPVVLLEMLIFKVPVHIELKSLPYLAYIGVVTTGVAYLLFFKGISKVGSSLGSMAFFIKPWIASFLAFLILSEKLSVNLIFGGILMAFSLLITYLPHTRHLTR